jgi:hypothetical protein
MLFGRLWRLQKANNINQGWTITRPDGLSIHTPTIFIGKVLNLNIEKQYVNPGNSPVAGLIVIGPYQLIWAKLWDNKKQRTIT